jgi:hypothetical protein
MREVVITLCAIHPVTDLPLVLDVTGDGCAVVIAHVDEPSANECARRMRLPKRWFEMLGGQGKSGSCDKRACNGRERASGRRSVWDRSRLLRPAANPATPFGKERPRFCQAVPRPLRVRALCDRRISATPSR